MRARASTFSPSLILPPVGKAMAAPQSSQMTTLLEWENAVVQPVQPGHLRERKPERGFGTRVFFLLVLASCWTDG